MQAHALELLSPEHREKLGLLARDLGGRYEGVFKLVEEAFTEKESLVRQTRKLDFSRRLLASASSTLDTAEIFDSVFETTQKQYPLSEISALLCDASGPVRVYLPAGLDKTQTKARLDRLLKLGGNYFKRELTQIEQTTLSYPKPVYSPRLVEPFARSSELVTALMYGGEPLGLLLSRFRSKLPGSAQAELRDELALLAPVLGNSLVHNRVKAMADHDVLTGLFNRRAFDERLRSEIMRHLRHNQPLTMLILDIDHFKKVNDTYGHPAGDEVLRRFAQVIQAGLRFSDFAARLGGEEFVILLPHTEVCQGLILAERLRERISALEIVNESKTIRITTSLGVAGTTELGVKSGKELITAADQALYQAKNSGRNRVVLAKPEVCAGLEPSVDKLQ